MHSGNPLTSNRILFFTVGGKVREISFHVLFGTWWLLEQIYHRVSWFYFFILRHFDTAKPVNASHKSLSEFWCLRNNFMMVILRNLLIVVFQTIIILFWQCRFKSSQSKAFHEWSIWFWTSALFLRTRKNCSRLRRRN